MPAFERIDAHAHAYSPSPLLFSMLRRQNIRIMDICVVDKHVSLDQREIDLVKDAGLQNRLTLSVSSQKPRPRSVDINFRSQSWELSVLNNPKTSPNDH